MFSDTNYRWATEPNDGQLYVERENGDNISIQSSSIDLHLGDEFAVPSKKENPVRVTDEDTYPEYEFVETETVIIEPSSFVLAHTDETVYLSNDVVGQIRGRSSVGRLGLFVHNAGLIDAGFEGQPTLELFNPAPYPIELETGMRICQLTVAEHNRPASDDYSVEGKYQDQTGVTPSKLYEDFE